MVDAADSVHVARRDGVDRCEVTRTRSLFETLTNAREDCVGTAQAARRTHGDDIPVIEKLCSVASGEDLHLLHAHLGLATSTSVVIADDLPPDKVEPLDYAAFYLPLDVRPVKKRIRGRDREVQCSTNLLNRLSRFVSGETDIG
jgi:hypothetical protein